MRRPQLEYHLLLRAEIDHLAVATLGQVPDVQLMTVTALQQDVRVDAVLDHLRRAPLAGDHRVVAEVPPEVVGEILRAAVELPATPNLEGVVVDDEDATWAVTGGGAEGADVNPIRAAVTGMRAAVAGAVCDFLRLDRLDDPWRAQIGLGIDDVDPGGADTGRQQVSALDMRVGGIRAQRGAAGIPAEVMQL